MSADPRARFDPDALRKLAGAAVFARGQEYHRGGLVEILRLEPAQVLARVSGTEDYRVALNRTGGGIGGDCSCPAYSDWVFCKHMVAAALTANDAGDGAEEAGAGMLARIRRHLSARGVDALVDLVMDLADRDEALFRRLELASSVEDADARTLETRLRKALDAATRTGRFVDYARAADWADGVGAVLDTIGDLASGPHAGLALRLSARAFDRIQRAIDDIDDSDGHCGGLMERVGDIHRAATLAARPEPVELARDLFAREMADDYGSFGGAALHYADALGDEGLAEYRRLAEDAWAQLPPADASRSRRRLSPGSYGTLARILDHFAERDGDVDARIALRSKDLSNQRHYLRLAEFCLEQGREALALERALEGLWVCEDERPDADLVIFAVGWLLKAGRRAEATEHLRRAFEKAPSLDLYSRLRKVEGVAARDRSIAFLEARIGAGKGNAWGYSGDLLVQIHMREKAFDAAWKAAGKYPVHPNLVEELAGASEATHPVEALQAYARRVDQLVASGGNAAYAEAVKLIAHMATLQGRPEHVALVLRLKQEHRRKRNFMKLLG